MGYEVMDSMLQLLWKGIRSVQVPSLIRSNFSYNKSADVLEIFNSSYNLSGKDVYVVGAGKAVYHMAKEVESLMGARLKKGIVSVPAGILEKHSKPPAGVIEYCEGAKNNMPDTQAEMTTINIMNLAESLDQKSVLIVLVSGGGSALMPAPIPPINLEDKCFAINSLVRDGADIIELNTVRKRLSRVKGGKLASLAHPAKVITLMLSDIVSSDDSFIASGPTFPDLEEPTRALEIMRKYLLYDYMPASVQTVLNNTDRHLLPSDMIVDHHKLGDNRVALNSIKDHLDKTKEYDPIIVSATIHGDVERLSIQYCELVETIIRLQLSSTTREAATNFFNTFDIFTVPENFLDTIANADFNKGVCLIFGGEPTVKISSTGTGGRSQHLALCFSIDLRKRILKYGPIERYDVQILCAGSDGIDGPTDAAGAVGFGNLPAEAAAQNLCADTYLGNNDSYNFYKQFANGKYHIKVGHTNTNIMDIHILVIKLKHQVL